MLVNSGSPISPAISVCGRDPLEASPVIQACSPTTQPEVSIVPDVKTPANDSPFWESEPSTSSQGRVKPADYTPFKVSLLLNANALPEVIDNNPSSTPENPPVAGCSQSSRESKPDSNHGPTVFYSKNSMINASM